jgi:hypothetical protein
LAMDRHRRTTMISEVVNVLDTAKLTGLAWLTAMS